MEPPKVRVLDGWTLWEEDRLECPGFGKELDMWALGGRGVDCRGEQGWVRAEAGSRISILLSACL